MRRGETGKEEQDKNFLEKKRRRMLVIPKDLDTRVWKRKETYKLDVYIKRREIPKLIVTKVID